MRYRCGIAVSQDSLTPPREFIFCGGNRGERHVAVGHPAAAAVTIQLAIQYSVRAQSTAN